MKLFAFAALLALPLFGLGSDSASADYYCCGKGHPEYSQRHAVVTENSVVFGCDGYHCQTNIKVYEGTKVKVFCRNGWCQIKNFPFDNVWVLETCLKYSDGYIGKKGFDEGFDEDGDYGKHRGYGKHRAYEGYGKSAYPKY